MEDGAAIRVRRHGIAGAPRLVLSHGNALAIDGYFSFWGRLLDRYDVIVYDFRNHGHNPPHHPAHHSGKDLSRTTNASGMRSANNGAPGRWLGRSIRSPR
jgi:pimeloyl-ACP methyl ester carboxylesterase